MNVVGTRAHPPVGFSLPGHDVTWVALTKTVDHDPFPDPAMFDGVLFSSANAVARAPASASWPRVGAVGPATERALAAMGVTAAVVGDEGGARLAEAWGDAHGQRLLLPQAQDSHPALADGLRARGATVVVAAVYRTVTWKDVDVTPFEHADAIAFWAPSQVRAFVALGCRVRPDVRYWAHGPTTRAALASAGLKWNLDALEDL